MAAVMIPALTRPAGVVRSAALSRLRLPRRSFTFALISSGCAGALAAWPTACGIGSWIAGILVRILDRISPMKAIAPRFPPPCGISGAGLIKRDLVVHELVVG